MFQKKKPKKRSYSPPLSLSPLSLSPPESEIGFVNGYSDVCRTWERRNDHAGMAKLRFAIWFLPTRQKKKGNMDGGDGRTQSQSCLPRVARRSLVHLPSMSDSQRRAFVCPSWPIEQQKWTREGPFRERRFHLLRADSIPVRMAKTPRP